MTGVKKANKSNLHTLTVTYIGYARTAVCATTLNEVYRSYMVRTVVVENGASSAVIGGGNRIEKTTGTAATVGRASVMVRTPVVRRTVAATNAPAIVSRVRSPRSTVGASRWASFVVPERLNDDLSTVAHSSLHTGAQAENDDSTYLILLSVRSGMATLLKNVTNCVWQAFNSLDTENTGTVVKSKLKVSLPQTKSR